mmetsp:Transcript_21632/g.57896  ORF Transcript_21632/g.57896 Transcript_21632/m.57896 type:complete len:214 (+) Transcript_21632:376-1017(+)
MSARMLATRKACNVPNFVPTMRNQSGALSSGVSSVEAWFTTKPPCTNVSTALSGLPWCRATLWKTSLERSLSSTSPRISKMLNLRTNNGVVEFFPLRTAPAPPESSSTVEGSWPFWSGDCGMKKIAISCELSQRINNCHMGHMKAFKTCTLELGGGGSVEMRRAAAPSMTRMAMSSDTRTVVSAVRKGIFLALSSEGPRSGTRGGCEICITGL